MRQAKLSGPIGACAVLLLLVGAPVSAPRAQVIYDDELVDGLPGPDALYDPDQGQPQSLLAEPREVPFPRSGPAARGRTPCVSKTSLRPVRPDLRAQLSATDAVCVADRSWRAAELGDRRLGRDQHDLDAT